MKRILITCFIYLSWFRVIGQLDSVDNADRFGAMFKADFGLDLSDQVFQKMSERRFSVGASFTPNNRKYVVFLGLGAHLFKYAIITPTFTHNFRNELNENYTPVQGASFDSLVGAAMADGNYFRGATGAWIHADFMWNNKFRPTVSFYYALRGIPCYGPGFVDYIDPDYQDIMYAVLNRTTYELKLGISPPFLNKFNWPFAASLNVGFKLIDYGSFSINNVNMITYTNDEFVYSHRFTGCFTFSISFQFWSNWIW